MPDKLSHEELRKLAVYWLKMRAYTPPGQSARGGRCSIISSELVSSACDTPDAIGWNQNGRSILIECKTSRADFNHEKGKTYRQNGAGLGNQRYFLTETGLIPKEKIPEGWGLLEYDGNRFDCIVPAPVRELSDFDQCNEKLILLSLIRRVNKREFLVIQSDEMEEILKSYER